MNHLKVYFFNVGAGQCILIVPADNPEQSILIDCGGDASLSPIKYLLALLHKSFSGKPILGCLAITHFDHDHISYLPELLKSVTVNNVLIPKNINEVQLKELKKDTEALQAVYFLMRNYTNLNHSYNPSFTLYSKCLEQNELDEFNFNNLSQIIFIIYGKTTICIPGDLEFSGWEKLLSIEEIRSYLSTTNILVAPHHGRENGYHAKIFYYCEPTVIIMSDKEVCYSTQESMSNKYSAHVLKSGIIFNNSSRKILTTRSDGQLILKAHHDGTLRQLF